MRPWRSALAIGITSMTLSAGVAGYEIYNEYQYTKLTAPAKVEELEKKLHSPPTVEALTTQNYAEELQKEIARLKGSAEYKAQKQEYDHRRNILANDNLNGEQVIALCMFGLFSGFMITGAGMSMRKIEKILEAYARQDKIEIR